MATRKPAKRVVPNKAPVGWALIRTNFEYDDERYSSAGADAPTKIFLNKQKGMKARLDLVRAWFVRTDFTSYAPSGDDFISEKGIAVMRKYDAAVVVMETEHDMDEDGVNGEKFAKHFTAFVKAATDEQLSEVLTHVNFDDPWQLHEVELEP